MENSNPEDKKAIVSINTEAGSFMFRHAGADGDNFEEDVNMELLNIEENI